MEIQQGGGSGGGSTIELQTNGVDNGDQTLLNLVNGTNITIVDDGLGNITFNSLSGGIGGSIANNQIAFGTPVADTIAGTGAFIYGTTGQQFRVGFLGRVGINTQMGTGVGLYQFGQISGSGGLNTYLNIQDLLSLVDINGTYGSTSAVGSGLRLDFANDTFCLGDIDGTGYGNGFLTIGTSGGTYGIYNDNNGDYLELNSVDKTYGMGDLSGTNLHTTMVINDILSITNFSGTFALPATGNGLSLDFQGGNFLLGDCDGVQNGTVIQVSDLGGAIIFHASKGVSTKVSSFQESQGADVTSASTLTLGNDGNTFCITDNNTIDLINADLYQAGTIINLILLGKPTLTHNASPSGTDYPMLLANSISFSPLTAPTRIQFVLASPDGGSSFFWYEVSRTLA